MQDHAGQCKTLQDKAIDLMHFEWSERASLVSAFSAFIQTKKLLTLFEVLKFKFFSKVFDLRVQLYELYVFKDSNQNVYSILVRQIIAESSVLINKRRDVRYWTYVAQFKNSLTA